MQLSDVADARPTAAPPSRLAAAAFAIPFVVLTAWTVAVAAHASVVVNGERLFYLDDTQMVAMRYGRNLAAGEGLVWNVGERVEGYSNPAWVLVMAAVHAAGVPDGLASLAVKVVAWLLAGAVLLFAVRLRQRIAGRRDWADIVVMVVLVLHADVVYWAANGFETPLLTALLLGLLLRVIDESASGGVRATTMLAAGALAVVRSDAHLLVAGVVIAALVLPPRRAQTAWLAALALVVPAVHVAARLAYYGDWLPNTFYLRMWAVPDLWLDGLRYVKRFGREHLVIAVLALAAAASLRGDRRVWALFAVCAAAAAHGVAVGGDALEHHRFIAPAVPLMAVLAVLTVEAWMRDRAALRSGALGLLVVTAAISGGTLSRWPVDAMRSWRGKPWQGAAIGRLMRQQTSERTTVAAIGGGALGYFSHRTMFDFTGRTDPAIARLPTRPGADAAARKFDVERTLGRRPDFVVLGVTHEAAELGPVMFALLNVVLERDLVPAIAASATFQSEYREQPVPLEPLLARSAVYVRRDSAERPGVSAWRLDLRDFR
jgi:arabinofuranosyltransferase